MPFLFQYADTTNPKSNPGIKNTQGDKIISVKIIDDSGSRQVTSISKADDIKGINNSFEKMKNDVQNTEKLRNAYSSRLAALRESFMPILDTEGRENVARIRDAVDNLAGAIETSRVVSKTNEPNHNELDRLFDKCEAFAPAFK